MGVPDVSVITTVRDGEVHLPQAVASAVARDGIAESGMRRHWLVFRRMPSCGTIGTAS